MSSVALAARIVLALTFCWSAAAKLRTWRELPAQLADFGVPQPLVRPAAVALPVVELALAILLVVFPRGVAPPVLALALLLIFSSFLLRSARTGVPCPCFGVADERPSLGASVVRNGVLLAIAVLATGDIAGAHLGGVLLATVVLGAIVVLVVAFSARAGRATARPR